MAYYDERLLEEIRGVRVALDKQNKILQSLCSAVAPVDNEAVAESPKLHPITMPYMPADKPYEVYCEDFLKVDNDVETILERAGVYWQDSISGGIRVVYSTNAEAPLTDDEKAMIKRMWLNQGFINDIIFINPPDITPED